MFRNSLKRQFVWNLRTLIFRDDGVNHGTYRLSSLVTAFPRERYRACTRGAGKQQLQHSVAAREPTNAWRLTAPNPPGCALSSEFKADNHPTHLFIARPLRIPGSQDDQRYRVRVYDVFLRSDFHFISGTERVEKAGEGRLVMWHCFGHGNYSRTVIYCPTGPMQSSWSALRDSSGLYGPSPSAPAPAEDEGRGRR